LDAYQELQELQSQGCYAGDKAIESLCEFSFNKDIRGEVLVPKDVEGSISEFILSGIFQVDARNFFMTSNGKWNSNNALGTRFEQVKPSCHPLPVHCDPEFAFSLHDFPMIMTTLRAIKNLADPHKSHDNISVIVGGAMQLTCAIKLMHHLFVVHSYF
jgi:hypothetical protein